ncbi:MAG TPA: hypothetical protein VE777_00290 [Gaiellales bacterium]|nr:hypothetical protein [Gaiellales bacterium]
MTAANVALAARPDQVPSGTEGICSLLRYKAVFGQPRWRDVPKEIRALDPSVQVWEERSLLYACGGCDQTAFRLDWVRRHHPDWIMHTASGAEVHPLRHPSWVLLAFGDAQYQDAWANEVRKSLAAGGWTGVDIVDAGNRPRWSGTPVDPATGRPLAEEDRVTDLAEALSLIHAAMRTQGFFVLAQNGPPGVIEPAEINSADGVAAGDGFAALRGWRWERLLRYYQQVQKEAGWAYVWETAPAGDQRRIVYGLASYLLVATPNGAYGAPAGTAPAAVYDLDLGPPDPGTPVARIGEAWARSYPSGFVAVNPSDLSTTLSMGRAGRVTLPPGSAAIAAGTRLVTTF